ncbi:MAG: hypothetical protein U1F12_11150 [Pseudomonadales bacterium]|jgi:hypothetical protein
MKRFVLLAILIISAFNASAGQRVEICATYMQKYGWSKIYTVEANLMLGNELNVATQTFDYQPYSKYVVIFWAQGQASIIELSMPYLNAFPSVGEDQQGRTWKVAIMGASCLYM